VEGTNADGVPVGVDAETPPPPRKPVYGKFARRYSNRL
jgi:hypothetical protein